LLEQCRNPLRPAHNGSGKETSLGSQREQQIAAGLGQQVAPALHIPDTIRVGIILQEYEPKHMGKVD